MSKSIFEPGTDELYFRLEYNEKQRVWHADNFTHEPNTFGWVTIAEREPTKKLSFFCNIMDEFFDGKKLTIKVIKQYWKFFDAVYKKDLF
jgi:hypothetical protein